MTQTMHDVLIIIGATLGGTAGSWCGGYLTMARMRAGLRAALAPVHEALAGLKGRVRSLEARQ